MAWIFSLELADSAWRWSRGLDQSFTANETDTLSTSFCHECGTTLSQSLQYGMTCGHYSRFILTGLSTSYSGVSRAKTSVLQGLEKAWKASEAVYSSRLSGSSKKLSQLSYFLKMSLQSGQEDLLVFAMNWPASGMIYGGQLSAPQALELRTSETDGSYLPTPTAQTYGTQTNPNAKPRPSLETMARKNLWPTPCARDWKDNGKSPSELNRNTTTLATIAGGQLNPQFVEWLMGYQIGWTELSALGTQWFRSKRVKRLEDCAA